MGRSPRAADAADHRTLWHAKTGPRRDAILMRTAITEVCEYSYAASALVDTKFGQPKVLSCIALRMELPIRRRRRHRSKNCKDNVNAFIQLD
jgi:hypothetical protein